MIGATGAVALRGSLREHLRVTGMSQCTMPLVLRMICAVPLAEAANRGDLFSSATMLGTLLFNLEPVRDDSARLWPFLERLLRGMCRKIRDAGFLAGHGRARDRKEIPRHAWQRLQNALAHGAKIGQSRAKEPTRRFAPTSPFRGEVEQAALGHEAKAPHARLALPSP